MANKVDIFLAQRFIHMLPSEVPLWQRFLVQHGEYFDAFEYDKHVGEGVPLDPSWAPNIVAAAKALTTKRIDAVGYRNSEIWIFEVKIDAGLSALGQLLAYKQLWEKDPGNPRVSYLGLVTDRINPDEEYLFTLNNIRIYIVTPQ